MLVLACAGLAATIVEELGRLQQAISEWAYDLFRRGDTPWGSVLGNWQAAECEFVSRPPIELRQSGDHFEVVARR